MQLSQISRPRSTHAFSHASFWSWLSTNSMILKHWVQQCSKYKTSFGSLLLYNMIILYYLGWWNTSNSEIIILQHRNPGSNEKYFCTEQELVGGRENYPGSCSGNELSCWKGFCGRNVPSVSEPGTKLPGGQWLIVFNSYVKSHVQRFHRAVT